MVWLDKWRFARSGIEGKQKLIEQVANPGNREARELLLAASKDGSAEVRASAAKALGIVKNDLSAAVLQQLLDDEDITVRVAAIAGIGHLGDSKSADVLVPFLRHPAPPIRSAAALSLRAIGWKPANSDECTLVELASATRRGLMSATGAAVTPLAGQLKSDTNFCRRAAAAALEGVKDPQRIPPLLAAMQDADSTVQVSAIYALAEEKEPAVTDALIRALGDRDSHVRLAAGQVLMKRHDPDHTESFLPLLEDSSFEVRATAIEFFRRVGNADHAEPVAQLLKDPDDDVRLAAANALSVLKNPAVIESLVLSLTDEQRAIRDAASMALDAIDPAWSASDAARRAEYQLEALQSDPRGWISSAAGQALRKIRATPAVLAD
jgi:HEAT repeat protein